MITHKQGAIVPQITTSTFAQAVERKYRSMEKTLDEWKRKSEELSTELAICQKEVRCRAAEIFKLEAALEEATEKEEALRRENKGLTEELHSINEQLGQGGSSFNEMQRQNRRLELEKQELQNTVEETLTQLEAEETKVSQYQLEIAQLKQDMENRLNEKEEEFQNTRLKKKLESDVTAHEVALEQANRANAEAQKNLKNYQEQVKQLQSQIEEEQKMRDQLAESLEREERRVHSLQNEIADISATLETGLKLKRQAEIDLEDSKIQINELQASNNSLATNSRKYEGEIQMLQVRRNRFIQRSCQLSYIALFVSIIVSD
ncbi:unnamed protein product [Soboliphyme baturini]|uniref:Myosin_tail_1 domain-containing protein n=1 Tax=Soboliphyme baturini TaxID=241478 RepID=A0A183J6S1_9BILA|nr:unnamed protein product [Soboliphyme baturini]